MSTGLSNSLYNSQNNQNKSESQPTRHSNEQIASSSTMTASTWHRVAQPIAIARPFDITSVQTPKNTIRPAEEHEVMELTTTRFNSRLAQDQAHVTYPDADCPFVDEIDVMNRLLPYHIFQQPKDDLEGLISHKGKSKACDSDWEEVEATKLALECFRRREALRTRWRNIKKRSGLRSVPDDQAYYLAQVNLDADRSENAWLGNELRTARIDLERIEREKRMSSNVTRMSHFSAAPQGAMPTVQAQYYRSYPYAYTQAYGNTTPPTVSTFSVSPPPATPTNYAPYQSTTAIPVQLPVASLPALHSLGIIPVPAASLPPDGQQQAPAVLRGSTANGTVLSLEINVSLLQSTQMSGLAMVLNSLVSRNNGSSSAPNSSSATPAVESASLPPQEN